jgi:predicted dehydrogenase
VKGVGLIGIGNIADVYVWNIARTSNARVVAVASRNFEHTRARAVQWNVLAESPEGLLRRDDIDIVLNLTPPAAHFGTTLAALEAGKHVFSEKPLGISKEQALALVEAADRRNLRLGVAPDSLLGAGLQKARLMITAGAIGRPLLATASIMYHGADDWHPNPAFFYQANGGGPVHDVGPYFLSALILLLGPIETIQASALKGFETRTFTAEGREKGLTVQVEVPTTNLALARFRSGAQASLMASWDVWRTGQPDLEIHGTEGSLSLPHPNWHGGPLRYSRAGAAWEEVPLEAEPMARPNWPPDNPLRANYRGIGIAEMIDAIHEGRPHRLPPDLATHVVECADAMVESAVHRKPIALYGMPQTPAHFTAADARRLLDPRQA